MINYTYSFSENRVYCMTIYAGKTIKGVAKRNPEDEFNLELGMELAKRRCDVKLAKAKLKRKVARVNIAIQEFSTAQEHLASAIDYKEEAEHQLQEAEKALQDTLIKLS